MSFLYGWIKPLLFRLDAEFVHNIVSAFASFLGKVFYRFRRPTQTASIAGVPIANRVGLAPGFVKNPRHRWIAPLLGFGFLEVGTLTRLGQSGNPRPRIFRLPLDRALVNRMGFNNPGYHNAGRYLRGSFPLATGVNIGKGKRTPPEQLFSELAEGIRLFTRSAAFFVINLSSPNTPGLRALLEPELLGDVLSRLRIVRHESARFWQVDEPPILLKLHPDLDGGAWQAMREWLPDAPIDGVVATNTSIGREGLASGPEEIDRIGYGGLSGRPLAPFRNQMLRELRSVLPPDKALIAVGGIMSGNDARECLRLGADACELYTGLIYSGPGIVKDAVRSTRRP